MIDYGCPIKEHITDVDIEPCKESRGQLQKIIIQRVMSSDGVKNTIPLTDIKTKTAMTKLFTAADGTKMVITPFFEDPTVEPGDPVTFGGGNQTLNGIPIIIDGEPTSVKAVFNKESQLTMSQLKQLGGEVIGVYLVFEGGNICCLADNLKSPQNLYPIPVQSFFVSDLKFGSRTDPDNNRIQWDFASGWSDKLITIKRKDLDYDPLTELVNKSSVSELP